MHPILKRPFSRRDFIKHSLRLSVFAALGFMYTRRDNLVVESVNLAFHNLPPAFNNFKIALISDLHASFWVGEDYLSHVVDKVNQLEKDLVVITGDIITGAVNDFWKKCIERLNGDIVLRNSKNIKKTEPASEHLSIEQKKKLRDQNVEPSEKTEVFEAPTQDKKPDEILEKGDQLDTKHVFEMLEGLVEGISTISSELGAIRKMMESDRTSL